MYKKHKKYKESKSKSVGLRSVVCDMLERISGKAHTADYKQKEREIRSSFEQV